MMRGHVVVALLVAALMGAPALASAQIVRPDKVLGQQLAARWCSGCHATEAMESPKSTDVVPSFVAIAHDATKTHDVLAAFLQDRHGQMPNFSLSNTEIADVVAYIDSLRP